MVIASAGGRSGTVVEIGSCSEAAHHPRRAWYRPRPSLANSTRMTTSAHTSGLAVTLSAAADVMRMTIRSLPTTLRPICRTVIRGAH
jgi:hypothetical protein